MMDQARKQNNWTLVSAIRLYEGNFGQVGHRSVVDAPPKLEMMIGVSGPSRTILLADPPHSETERRIRQIGATGLKNVSFESHVKHYRGMSVSKLSSLAEDNPIDVDRDNQRFGSGTSVRLSTVDTPFSREDDARKLFVIIDVVRRSCSAIDFDGVVLSPQ
jgi:hypothetical protein